MGKLGKGEDVGTSQDHRDHESPSVPEVERGRLRGAALLGVAGCGGGETIQGGQGGGGGGAGSNTFIFGRGADSVSLDPINTTDGESLRVTRQIFDGLLDFAPESTDVIPALATEIPEPEDGGRSYTFTLREGVTFHDGAPFNAEAVVFNFDAGATARTSIIRAAADRARISPTT